MKNFFIWTYFVFIQLVNFFILLPVGAVILIPLAATKSWVFKHNSEFPDRLLPQWRGGWLTFIWGNLEDGVIGTPLYQQKHTFQPLCAYLWSGWRNFANNARFIFRRRGGPFYRWENKARTYYFQCGWFVDNGFPVISAGKIDVEPQA